MKKFLLSVSAAVFSLMAGAQNFSINVEKMSDKVTPVSFDLLGSSILEKSAVGMKSHLRANADAEVIPMIESGVDYTDGAYEEQIGILTTAEATFEYTGKTGEYKGVNYPEVHIVGMAGGYAEVIGYVDDINGKIYIPRQVAYEYPDKTKGYGKMYLEALVINEDGTQITWTGEDLVLFKTEYGYVAWDGTEEPGAMYGWVITMPEYMDGYDDEGLCGIWNYGMGSDYMFANAEEEETISLAQSGSWTDWERVSRPVYVDDQGDEIVVYNFMGQTGLLMYADEGEVYIPAGQPIETMPGRYYETEGYGEYFRTYNCDITEEGKIIPDPEAEYTMAIIEGNTITMNEDNMIHVASLIDEEGMAYRMAYVGDVVITLNEGDFIAGSVGIKDLKASQNNNVRYNLNGQRVNSVKGIVISNGKKYVK